MHDGILERNNGRCPQLIERIRSGQREGHYYAALARFPEIRCCAPRESGRARVQLCRVGAFPAEHELSQRTSRSGGDSERTLARRKEAGRLEPSESDRVARISRVFARAIDLFDGNVDSARAWLTQPSNALGDRTPLEFARTDAGAIEVEHLIGRLEHGIPV